MYGTYCIQKQQNNSFVIIRNMAKKRDSFFISLLFFSFDGDASAPTGVMTVLLKPQT